MNLKKHALIICAGLLLTGSLRADTIVFDSLDSIPGPYTTTESSDSIRASAGIYASFSTGGVSGPISEVAFMLQNGATDPVDSITVNLYADSLTAPGSLIATLGSINDLDLGTSPTPIDLSLTSTPTLASFTRYWIGLAANTDVPEWDWTEDVSGTGVSGEYFDSGDAGFAASNLEGPYQMEVAVGSSSVPEPSTLFLSSFALLALAGLRWRRTAKH